MRPYIYGAPDILTDGKWEVVRGVRVWIPAALPVRREPEGCGSDPAYQRHLRAGETPCQPCRVAHREAQRAWRELDRRERAS